MGLSKETLALLGLPETATDEEINAKVAELNGDKIKVEGERDNFKRSFDKTSSELASLKREKMTDEEKRQEAETELKNQLAEAQRQIKLNETEKKYLGVGMDADSAKEMAQAVLEGDLDKQGSIMKSYTEMVANKAKAEALKGQPNPNLGDGSNIEAKYTKENFKKGLISMEEMNKLKDTNPTLYNEIIK